MRRAVSLFLPHRSTDRLRRKTDKRPPDEGRLAADVALVTAILDLGRRIVSDVDLAAQTTDG